MTAIMEDILGGVSFIVKRLSNMVTSPLGLNVVGGLLASIVAFSLSWVLNYHKRQLRRRRFKQIFGPGGGTGSHTLVYGALALRSTDQYPYVKPGSELVTGGFSISQPVSVAEVRAANYLASAIGKFAGVTPSLRSDIDVRTNLDFDFISFGGPGSNFKTADCQSNAGNRLALFDPKSGRFVERRRIDSPLTTFEPGFDYGMILKIRPAQFPSRVWISCIGIGEWGTSGTAWFLANKWNQLRVLEVGYWFNGWLFEELLDALHIRWKKVVGDRPFAAVIRVRQNQDESAELVRWVAGNE